MELTDAQKKTMADWVAAGETIGAIQKKISEEFHVSMTYMEARFLLDDLGLKIKDQVKPKPRPDTARPSGINDVVEESDEGAEDGSNLDSAPSAGGVSVEIDRITKPGAVVSGTTTFTDGVAAKWALDGMGRLALSAEKPGYRPSEADLRAFQVELSGQLRKRGF